MKPVIGLGMMGAGILLVYGGITGRLAPMIAALFTPSLLTNPTQDSSVVNKAHNIIDEVAPYILGPIAGNLIP